MYNDFNASIVLMSYVNTFSLIEDKYNIKRQTIDFEIIPYL